MKRSMEALQDDRNNSPKHHKRATAWQGLHIYSVEFRLPQQQQQQELGAFWISQTGHAAHTPQLQATVQPTGRSRQQELSISLAQGWSGGAEEEMQDTACSDAGGWHEAHALSPRSLRSLPRSAAAAAAQPGTADTAAFTGRQPAPPSAAAAAATDAMIGSGGCRANAHPCNNDIFALFCWEVLPRV